MSSSDPTSIEKSSDARERGTEESFESLDESLDAILSEAKEAAQPASDAPTAREALPETAADSDEAAAPPPPAEVEMALADEPTAIPGITDADAQETPLPVTVDDFEDERAASGEELPWVEKSSDGEAPALTAAPEAPSSAGDVEQIFEAEGLVESMTPAPEAQPAPMALAAATEPSAPPAPPTDEEILEHVVLPGGSVPTPSPLLGSALDEDRTVISPMPPAPEPSLAMPPIRNTWSPDSTAPILLRQSDGLVAKVRRVAGARVQASVAQLAVVVVAASALGGVAVRILDRPAARPVAVVAPTAPAKLETAEASRATAAAATQEAEPGTPAAASAEAATTPANAHKMPARPAAARPKSRPAATQVALAKPPVAASSAPAAKPAAATKRPAPAAPAAKPHSTNWVDPFGQ